MGRVGVGWGALAGVGAGGEADALEDLIDGLVRAREMGGGDGTGCVRHESLLLCCRRMGERHVSPPDSHESSIRVKYNITLTFCKQIFFLFSVLGLPDAG
jgi:hypothetical protein